MNAKEIAQLIATAGQFHDVGKLKEAEGLYRQALTLDPHRPEAMCGLGLVLSQQGRHEEAIRYLPWQTVWHSQSPLLLTALGSSMLALGGVDGAVESAGRAVEINPGFAPAHNLLGCALLARGELDRSVHSLYAAIQLQPRYVDAYYNLGTALSHGGAFAQAEQAFAVALQLHPKHAKAHLNRGFVVRELGKLDDALADFHRAAELRPEFPEALHNIGATLAEKGRVHEGIEYVRRAFALNPLNFHAHSALIYMMNFDPNCGPAELAQETAKWGGQHAAKIEPLSPRSAGDASSSRLRIGYVSPDFRQHAESWFLLPLLATHDRQAFEIHCYSSVRRPDAVTEKMRALADHWHDVKMLSDAQLAEKIRSDGIDILVDLTMHMESHRLLTFARRPAPVQIAWLGYPAGTGVDAIQYRISDPHLSPPDRPSAYSEQVLRLPHSWFCYQPSPDAPPVQPPPSAKSGVVTFGSLNSFRKMSQAVVDFWAETLARVESAGQPTALILTCPEGDHRTEVLAAFAARGIGAEKIRLLSHLKYDEYLATYHQIDIALDPFPHNGATTTCEALWMGVPVLTLPGETEPSRLGKSILSTVGLQDWIAHSREDFISKAVSFSRDARTLATLRDQMRDRLRASPLLDAPAFARAIGSAFRQAFAESQSKKST